MAKVALALADLNAHLAKKPMIYIQKASTRCSLHASLERGNIPLEIVMKIIFVSAVMLSAADGAVFTAFHSAQVDDVHGPLDQEENLIFNLQDSMRETLGFNQLQIVLTSSR
jgi:hypothetical protein